jgi:hypothetical protein
LLRRNIEFQMPHKLAVFGPGDVLLVVVAHSKSIGWIAEADERSDRCSAVPGGGRGVTRSA